MATTGNTSFEQLLIEQSNALTNISPDKFLDVFEGVVLKALEYFDLDRLTIFPNSMLTLRDGRSFSVSRPGAPKLNLNLFTRGNYLEYLKMLKVQRQWQIFDAEMLRTHPLDPLKALYQEGGRWHGVVQLKMFGQTWGAMSFSRFHESSTPLDDAQIQRLKLLCDTWLCFWQHSSVALSLTQDGESYTHEHDKLLLLSEKQCTILSMLAQGLTAKQCAEKLFLSPRTVESHKYRMLSSLGLKTHAELVQFAIRNGLGTNK